ncbi:MAG: FAD-dependent oxidoreductase [Actinomycetales bacterium]|nr:FAD-dependent oxidoreductase [Actinomycetales bacterium]
MRRILIVGGGYAGFYTAKKLEKHLARGEAEVTMVDPVPYMTYQPFLPEVAAGSIDPRHAIVDHRRHLKRTNVVTASVTRIDHASKQAEITPAVGEPWMQEYDDVIVTAGAVTRTFPIPGVADQAIGLKAIEEAMWIRDRLVGNFAKAANLPAGPERDRLLTVVVVGGGFAGIEIYAELRSFASALLGRYPGLSSDDVHFHLIEAMGRIMPEVSLKTAGWVIKNLEQRDAKIHLDTQLASAVDGKIELSTGETFESDLIVWTAGVMAAPMIGKTTDLPTDQRGRLTVQADLRVIDADGNVVPGAWGAGDVAAVPDLSGDSPLPDSTCVPNAQHAVRQGKRMAKNLAADIRGEKPVDYFHHYAGAVAGLGLYVGAFQYKKLGITGLIAWFMHRGYHGFAMPMWERKARVFSNWIVNFFWKRDLVGIPARDEPRAAFASVAARPKG